MLHLFLLIWSWRVSAEVWRVGSEERRDASDLVTRGLGEVGSLEYPWLSTPGDTGDTDDSEGDTGSDDDCTTGDNKHGLVTGIESEVLVDDDKRGVLVDDDDDDKREVLVDDDEDMMIRSEVLGLAWTWTITAGGAWAGGAGAGGADDKRGGGAGEGDLEWLAYTGSGVSLLLLWMMMLGAPDSAVRRVTPCSLLTWHRRCVGGDLLGGRGGGQERMWRVTWVRNAASSRVSLGDWGLLVKLCLLLVTITAGPASWKQHLLRIDDKVFSPFGEGWHIVILVNQTLIDKPTNQHY